MKHHRRGLIAVFTGDGKGKTTAAFGLALRAAGQGLKVLIVQFMKGQRNIGEIKALVRCSLPIDIQQFGREGFVQSRACEPLDIYLADKGIKCVRTALLNPGYDLLVLDEILVAINFGLLKASVVCGVLEKKPDNLHVVLTGRNAHEDIVKMADLVTDMRAVRHPYENGVRAQVGIEF